MEPSIRCKVMATAASLLKKRKSAYKIRSNRSSPFVLDNLIYVYNSLNLFLELIFIIYTHSFLFYYDLSVPINCFFKAKKAFLASRRNHMKARKAYSLSEESFTLLHIPNLLVNLLPENIRNNLRKTLLKNKEID